MSLDIAYIKALLDRFLDGQITREQLQGFLEGLSSPYVSVQDFAKVDIDRRRRTGTPEFIYAPGKSVDQIAAIALRMVETGLRNILVTRAETTVYKQVAGLFPSSVYHALSKMIVIEPGETGQLLGKIGIATAGTSDIPVAEEAEIACRALGSLSIRIADIGIACLARTLDAVPELLTTNVIICIAGMEATLPSVLAGLVPVPIIAVPTSVGYGVNAGGFNALFSALGSCAPGITVVNIDNGIGAAAAAHRINTIAVEKRI